MDSMKKIDIMAPARDLDMARYQCDGGAKELYMGLNGKVINDSYVHFTLNGRFNRMDNVPCQVESKTALKNIINYSHDRNVVINYTVNMHYLSSSLTSELRKYLDIGLECGIDRMIVSNLGIIRQIRAWGIKIPIVVGVFLFTPNASQTALLEELDVQRVVLPQGITLDEIASFKKKTNLKIEIFAHFGGGNNCGRCMLLHSPTISDIGPGCRAAYDVYSNGRQIDNDVYFLDAAADCCLCNIPDLMRIGVDTIKIVGRESGNSFINSKVTELYSRFQELTLEGYSVEEIRNIFNDQEIMWTSMWKERFCSRKRCRFKKTRITESYIV